MVDGAKNASLTTSTKKTEKNAHLTRTDKLLHSVAERKSVKSPTKAAKVKSASQIIPLNENDEDVKKFNK
jgi:hypothetical protein